MKKKIKEVSCCLLLAKRYQGIRIARNWGSFLFWGECYLVQGQDSPAKSIVFFLFLISFKTDHTYDHNSIYIYVCVSVLGPGFIPLNYCFLFDQYNHLRLLRSHSFNRLHDLPGGFCLILKISHHLFGVISSLLFVDLILFFCGNISVVNYYQIGVMMKSFDCFLFSLWVLTRTRTFFFFFFSSLLLSSSLALSWVIQLLPSWLCFFSSSKILFGFIIG